MDERREKREIADIEAEVCEKLEGLERTKEELIARRLNLKEELEDVERLLKKMNEASLVSARGTKMSRREILLQIIPTFYGEPFTTGDVRKKFLEEYLEHEPPNFEQAVSNLLKRMANRGEVERMGRRGEAATSPWLYRAAGIQSDNGLSGRVEEEEEVG